MKSKIVYHVNVNGHNVIVPTDNFQRAIMVAWRYYQQVAAEPSNSPEFHLKPSEMVSKEGR